MRQVYCTGFGSYIGQTIRCIQFISNYSSISTTARQIQENYFQISTIPPNSTLGEVCAQFGKYFPIKVGKKK